MGGGVGEEGRGTPGSDAILRVLQRHSAPAHLAVEPGFVAVLDRAACRGTVRAGEHMGLVPEVGDVVAALRITSQLQRNEMTALCRRDRPPVPAPAAPLPL